MYTELGQWMTAKLWDETLRELDITDINKTIGGL
jgi:hypothetical protein